MPPQARQLDAALAPIWDLFRQYSSLRVVCALAETLDVCRAEPPRPILPLPEPVKRHVAEMLAGRPSGMAKG